MQSKYKIHIKEIDQDHEKIFTKMEQIHEFFDDPSDQPRWRYGWEEGISFIKSFFPIHFVNEESYMENNNYEDIEKHKQAHKEFWNLIEREEKIVQDDEYSVYSIRREISTLFTRYTTHILSYDAALSHRGLHELKKVEKDNIQDDDVVSGLGEMIAVLTGHVVTTLSTSYELDEELRDGIFYAVDFKTSKGEKITALFILEPKLVKAVFTETLGYEITEINDTLVEMMSMFVNQALSDVLKNNFDISASRTEEILSGRMLFSVDGRDLVNRIEWGYKLLYGSDLGKLSVMLQKFTLDI